jgi:hypothetical protein
VLPSYKVIVNELRELRLIIKELRDLQFKVMNYLSQPVLLTAERKKLLMTVPSFLLKSYFALETLKEGTATQVSRMTGRCRSVESAYLNELTRMGLVRKETRGQVPRRGRVVVFKIVGQDQEPFVLGKPLPSEVSTLL